MGREGTDQPRRSGKAQSQCLLCYHRPSNGGALPTKDEFDTLITEGSSEWRNLCENEDYMQRFPDKHFDLEIVLEADLKPLSVMPDRSFIGFFSPEKFESFEGTYILRWYMGHDKR
uniref:Uncharacterized protein n=1 Tax=Nelumbo nucifera TaxID=4432 RepID=A0A822ZRY3_NELNU|nr:TPA_asm: hypothetical protein HUJ06_017949 [Nelumbo nucifera]